MTGPLNGVRIVTMGGLGPTPFCGMLLGDLGADVIRVDHTRVLLHELGLDADTIAELVDAGVVAQSRSQ